MYHPECYQGPSEPVKSLHVLDILQETHHAGLGNAFIYSLMEYCQRYEELCDLMEMRLEETDSTERDKIIADLQESINDAPKTTQERPYLRFDDLNEIKHDVAEFKKQLKKENRP